MTEPTLVATLSARSLPETRAAIEEARAAGADLAEVRFDLWDRTEIATATELFPSPLPLIATYRSAPEGGGGSADRTVRVPLLEHLRALPFAYVDREVARDPAPPAELAERSIGSRHLAAPVDWSTFGEMLRRGRSEGELAKTIAPATLAELFGQFAPAATGAPSPERPRTVLATGPAGPLSRIWPDRWGSSWVFGSYGPPGRPVLEPAQLPIDRLASTLRRNPPGPFFALLGHPVRHSPSPDLHHGWMRAAGLPGAYVALDVETEREFRDLWPLLGPGGFRGLNVTHPWKTLARALAAEAEPAAREADAANCLTYSDGRWTAALTDAEAIEQRLVELRAEGAWDGREFALLGSGGAARAALVAARRRSAVVRVWARRRSAVDGLLLQFPGVATLPGPHRPPLVVHATPAGRDRSAPLAPELWEAIPEGAYCLDFVYRAERTELADRVREMGGRYEDGTRLLRLQAAASFQRWFGEAPGEAE